MLADINLRFLCQVFQTFFVVVELYNGLGKLVRLILDEENFFYIRDSLAADGGGDDEYRRRRRLRKFFDGLFFTRFELEFVVV